MVLGRYLQQRGKGSRVRLDAMSYLLGNVLVDEQNGDILALLGELVKSRFDGRVLSLCVDDEEVFLAVWRLRDVLETSVKWCTCSFVACGKDIRRRQQVACLLLYPAHN
jgi:hypothetical protein